MATTVCAYCKSVSTMTPVWAEATYITGSNTARLRKFKVAAICNNQSCRGINVAIGRSPHDISTSQLVATATMAMDDNRGIEWHPTTVIDPEYPSAPRHVELAAKEAHRCAATGSPMAAILMARTVLEAVAKSKDIIKGRLLQKIDEMQQQGLIRANIARAAHAIRHFGNDMAHGDIEDDTPPQDAKDVLTLMDLVLAEVYEGDALAERILASRGPGRAGTPT